MYEAAQRALINNTAKHSRNDASGTKKRVINDRQYRRKRLCRRCFRYTCIRPSLLDRRRNDSPRIAEIAFRGL
jgi:hypothetical protein